MSPPKFELPLFEKKINRIVRFHCAVGRKPSPGRRKFCGILALEFPDRKQIVFVFFRSLLLFCFSFLALSRVQARGVYPARHARFRAGSVAAPTSSVSGLAMREISRAIGISSCTNLPLSESDRGKWCTTKPRMSHRSPKRKNKF